MRAIDTHREARQPCQGRHKGGVDTAGECHHALTAPEPDRLADGRLQVHPGILRIDLSDWGPCANDLPRRPGARGDPEPVPGSAVVPLERELTSECGCCTRVAADEAECLFRGEYLSRDLNPTLEYLLSG
ncbi:MAG: hypothetical protein A4E37_00037 [Methanoregulaceae archaeon PtaB.Bin056]|nr:MAG: hypothetical protein A4E37_00037 [Methanoregulaceae archaeon PtaB.Bin056]OPY44768.1 MAG: hypothetical protein A4E42_00976 [Methanoregulaceae archaeon PtaU1.Bin222]